MKEAIESLLPFERDLFFALNGSESQFLDNVMWTISGRFVWIPFFLFIIFLFFYKAPLKTAIPLTIFLILVFAASDLVSSSFFKPFFERYRPTHHPDFMEFVDTLNDYRGGRFGFISGHATNSFGLATFLSLVYRNRFVTLASIFWALLNSYTRIYLGVHFISDIIAGAAVGALIAYLLYLVYNNIAVRYRLVNESRTSDVILRKKGNLLSVALMSYIFLLIVFSPFLSTIPH